MSIKAEARGRKAAGVHYRRTVYPIVIGTIHAYLLWYGDILVTYGLCALVVFLFRKVSPKWLLTIGLIAISVPFLLFLFFEWSISFWPPEAYQDVSMTWSPSTEIIAEEVAAYQGRVAATNDPSHPCRPRNADFLLPDFARMARRGYDAHRHGAVQVASPHG